MAVTHVRVISDYLLTYNHTVHLRCEMPWGVVCTRIFTIPGTAVLNRCRLNRRL